MSFQNEKQFIDVTAEKNHKGKLNKLVRKCKTFQSHSLKIATTFLPLKMDQATALLLLTIVHYWIVSLHSPSLKKA